MAARDDLIVVDASGVAHPIGTLALQRLRRRPGTFRCLPSPDHVVFLRYTGDDGRVDAEDGATVRIAGEITAPGMVCDVVGLLAQTGWKGVLRVQSPGAERSAFIEAGSVLSVRSSDPEERIGAILYRYGHIDDAGLRKIEAALTPGRRFGETAMELGVVEREVLYTAFRQQITEVLTVALQASEGTYFFLDGFDEAELASRQAVRLNHVLMEAVTRMDELRFFAEKIPSFDHVPLPLPHSAPPPPELADVLSEVDGLRSVAEIGRRTGLGEFETTRRLFSLIQSRHVQVQIGHAPGGPRGTVVTANLVLGAAFERAQAAGRCPELVRALESFSAGAGPLYDLLLQGAGPDSAGRLDPERVLANLPLVSSGSDAAEVLGRLLYDYVAFALFTVGGLVSREVEAELQRSLRGPMNSLQPPG